MMHDLIHWLLLNNMNLEVRTDTDGDNATVTIKARYSGAKVSRTINIKDLDNAEMVIAEAMGEIITETSDEPECAECVIHA